MRPSPPGLPPAFPLRPGRKPFLVTPPRCFAVVLNGVAVPATGQRGVWGCLEPVRASGRRIPRPAGRRSRGAAWLGCSSLF